MEYQHKEETRLLLHDLVGSKKATLLCERFLPAAITKLTEGGLIANGLTALQARRFVAARSLFLNSTQPLPEEVNSPADAGCYAQQFYNRLEKERLGTIMLNARRGILGFAAIIDGSLNSSQIRANEVFVPALRNLAYSIILVHNHPSGDPTPGPDDIDVTRALVQAGKLLDIEVIDHIILGAGERFISMKERGFGF